MSVPSPEPRGGSLRVAVAGQGQVGLPLAMALCDAGHHFVYLLEHLTAQGIDPPLVRAALEANAERPRAVARALAARLPGDHGGRALLVGVAYKADVSETRLTPARIIRDMIRSLGHEVWFHDPLVPELDGEPSAPLTEELVRSVDVIALLVAHRGVEWSMLAASGRPVLDACGVLAGAGVPHVTRV